MDIEELKARTARAINSADTQGEPQGTRTLTNAYRKLHVQDQLRFRLWLRHEVERYIARLEMPPARAAKLILDRMERVS